MKGFISFVISFVLTLVIGLFITIKIAHAEDYVIATIDLDRVLNDSKDAQSKRKEIDAMSAVKKKEIEAKRLTLKNLNDKLKSAKVSDDSKEAEDFRTQARNFERMVKDAEDELKKEYVKSTKDLMKRANGIIEAYSKKKNLSLVLEKSSRGPGAVLYGSNTMDITEDVLGELNKG